jgi:hypothetical protein
VLELAYVFSLVLGGVLLGGSMVLGGKDADHGGGDHEAHGGGEGDADADAGTSGQGLQGVHAHGASHGSEAGLFATFLSLRFWTFFLAFFGLTGLTFTWLGAGPGGLLGAALAAATGAGTGLAADRVVRLLAQDRSAAVAGSSDYIGLTARVLVPLRPGQPGKIRLQLRGTTVDVLATSDEPEGADTGSSVLVLQMDGPQAVVARAPTPNPESDPS